ncbi:hypothetical protein B0T19DRAFT_178850 [Cercophora scortea]|uniref:Uncharacterized protein n=1 Tax=Cercophora scortea TaxID=314031 RepID=A0AAE0MEC8_9PEZI|nr:hypothetical protein B0T19DRAFT_178850 [Cercophora scortea]
MGRYRHQAQTRRPTHQVSSDAKAKSSPCSYSARADQPARPCRAWHTSAGDEPRRWKPPDVRVSSERAIIISHGGSVLPPRSAKSQWKGNENKSRRNLTRPTKKPAHRPSSSFAVTRCCCKEPLYRPCLGEPGDLARGQHRSQRRLNIADIPIRKRPPPRQRPCDGGGWPGCAVQARMGAREAESWVTPQHHIAALFRSLLW